jgi:hypothetical protein
MRLHFFLVIYFDITDIVCAEGLNAIMVTFVLKTQIVVLGWVLLKTGIHVN